MLENEKTENLMDELRDSSNVYSYISKYNTDFPNISFIDFIALVIEKKHLKKSQVVKATGLQRNYAYQLMSGKKNPSRDKVLTFAFGLCLDLEDTQKFLRVAQFNLLYPKQKRDSIIIYALCNSYTLDQTNFLLDENKEEPIN